MLRSHRAEWHGRSLMKKHLRKIPLLLAIVVLSACGGGDSSPGASDTTSTTEATTTTEPGYAHAGFEFVRMTPSDCERTQSLGTEAAVTLKLPPSPLVATPWTPQCLTDVKEDRLTVTIESDNEYQHNFIVEGNEIEVFIDPGKKKTVEIELPDQGQIGFQCTLHPPMFGAIFR